MGTFDIFTKFTKWGKAALCAFLATAAAVCSDDAEEAVATAVGWTGQPKYVAVTVAQPGSPGMRATSAGFEYGTDDENYMQDGVFFIFSADGASLYGKAQRLALAGTGRGTAPRRNASSARCSSSMA